MKAQRTEEAVGLIHDLGGDVVSMYATLGEHDLVFVVRFPGVTDAMKASVALGKMSGIGFTTAPAIPIERFDELIGDA